MTRRRRGRGRGRGNHRRQPSPCVTLVIPVIHWPSSSVVRVNEGRERERESLAVLARYCRRPSLHVVVRGPFGLWRPPSSSGGGLVGRWLSPASIVVVRGRRARWASARRHHHHHTRWARASSSLSVHCHCRAWREGEAGRRRCPSPTSRRPPPRRLVGDSLVIGHPPHPSLCVEGGRGERRRPHSHLRQTGRGMEGRRLRPRGCCRHRPSPTSSCHRQSSCEVGEGVHVRV